MNSLLRALALAAGLSAIGGPALAQTPTVAWNATTAIDGAQISPGWNYDGPRSMALDADDNLIAVGTAAFDEPTDTCMLVVKYAESDGRELWRKTFCGGYAARAVAVDRSGDVIALGDVRNYTNYSSKMAVLKCSGKDGELQWSWISADSSSFAGGAVDVSLDAQGNAFVAGNLNSDASGAPQPSRIAKLRGSDGALLWLDRGSFQRLDAISWDGASRLLAAGRRASGDTALFWLGTDSGGIVGRTSVDSSGNLYAASIAVDPAGNAIVGGPIDSPADPGSYSLKVLKVAAGGGPILWQRSTPSSTHAGVGGLGIDPQGNIVVAGSVDYAMTTLKLAPLDGRVLWRSDYPGSSWAESLALDEQGNAIVTGWNDGGLRRADIRTIEYASATGAPLWSIGYDEGGNDFGIAVVHGGGGDYVVGASNRNGTDDMVMRVFKYSEPIVPDVPAIPTYQGLWWAAPAGSESGWGLSLAHQGDILFATWFTYDIDGSPLWLVMPDLRRRADGSFSGAIYRTHGPAFDSSTWDPSLVRVQAVGTATLSFADPHNGSFSYDVGGATATKSITRQVFALPVHDCSVYRSAEGVRSFTDLYWAYRPGSQSGWGVSIAHEGDILFSVWFTYRADGEPVWYVMSDGTHGVDGSYAGTLFQARGPSYRSSPWDPSAVSLTAVGDAWFRFISEDLANYRFQVGSATVGGGIVRQSFSTPASDCR